MKHHLNFLVFLLLSSTSLTLNAQIKVIVNDVGAGHSSIIKLPNNKFVLFDAGGAHSDGGKVTFEKIQKEIDTNSTIELVVVSHSDADHLYAVKNVLETYKVKRIIHTGYAKPKHIKNPNSTYNGMLNAIESSRIRNNTVVINLNSLNRQVNQSDNLTIGDVQFEFLCGFGRPLDEWDLEGADHESERLNAVSIVVKMTYKEASVLFTGDAVGRFRRDSPETLKATDKFLIEHRLDDLDADVVIAPHHGADNGSSSAFCKATSPKWVIFPAGSTYGHPVKQTVERYHTSGTTSYENMFRTDRGEGYISSTKLQKYQGVTHEQLVEWNGQSLKRCKDQLGDDDVIIDVDAQGHISVFYKNADPCDISH